MFFKDAKNKPTEPSAQAARPKGPSWDLSDLTSAFMESVDQDDDPLLDELRVLTREVQALKDKIGQAPAAAPSGAPAPRGRAMDEVADFLYRKLQYPLMRDLMLYYDRVAGSATEAEGGASLDELRATIRSFRDEIGDLLYEHGVEPIPVSGRMDPELHQARTLHDTPDRTLDKQIVRVVRQGFMSQGLVLRKAEVEAYRYTGEAR